MLSSLLDHLTGFVLAYFVTLNLGYLSLNVLSLSSLWRALHERPLDELPQVYSDMDPGISLLVPAYNEQASIVDSVRSMLGLSYSNHEIIVINDGSKDETVARLIEAFDLEPFPESVQARLPTQDVLGYYRSRRHPNLRLIDKVNGGKADSLNAGINLARHDLFCGVDADSLLERDSLQRVVKPFRQDPRVVATGGTVRVANGCRIEGGVLTRVDLPSNLWALFQVVEYLRAFLFGRLGWSQLNAMLIISGAFGLFRRDLVIEVGGYRVKTIGEDMELVVRLHRHLRDQQRPYRIEFVPDPVCWTEAPEDVRTLRNQRIRWQRGLSETMSAHAGLMFNRRGGAPGWLAYPFFVAFEWLGPLLELLGYVFMVLAWIFGLVSWQAFGVFLFVAIGLGILLSFSSLLLEEMAFHLYPKARQLALLALVVVLENFGYRQLNSWWRLIGLWRWATQRESTWGDMKRKGLSPGA